MVGTGTGAGTGSWGVGEGEGRELAVGQARGRLTRPGRASNSGSQAQPSYFCGPSMLAMGPHGGGIPGLN